MALIDEYIDRAGSDAVVMVADGETLADLRANTPPDVWGKDGIWDTYRGARVELHDEWSWGWMVRRADGSYVSEADAPELLGELPQETTHDR